MRDSIRLRIWRTHRTDGDGSGFQELDVRVERDLDTVLDVLERARNEVDPTLAIRHACHHASCGTCAVRVDGRERLACLARLDTVWNGRSRLQIEPLRNLPILADVAVDPAIQLQRLEAVGFPYVRTVEADVRRVAGAARRDDDVGTAERFEDCIECFACVSACPVASGAPEYLGPAVLAAAQRVVEEPRGADVDRALELVDSDHGVWQCRSAWACSAVCPSGVDPAARIMDLRRRLLTTGPRPAGVTAGVTA